jgi:arylamine N-acetyltransferase
LAGLLRVHLLLIPYGNFDILLGRGVRLDLDTFKRNWSTLTAAAIVTSTRHSLPP